MIDGMARRKVITAESTEEIQRAGVRFRAWSTARIIPRNRL